MYKSRKTTWSKNTHKWLKTIGVDTTLTQEEIVNTVRIARQNNFARQTNTIANNQAIELGIKSSKLIRTTQFTKKCHHMGINALVRIRMGTFLFTKHLIRTNNFEQDFRNRCLFCGDDGEEDLWHFVKECKAFQNIRANNKILATTKYTRQNRPDSILRNNILSILLGGGEVASRFMKPSKRLMYFIEYLSVAVPLRLALIKSRTVSDQGSA
ncbi:hypothetical protein GVAV_000042 [Gurleya vavrai]